MILILDTNVLSALRRPERVPGLVRWLDAQEEETLFLSVISLGEIERGIAMQERRDPQFASDLKRWIEDTMALFFDRLLPFGAEEARIWGRMSAALGHDGADLLIAATAEARGATVVTGNERHFRPTGVPVINPF